MGWGNSIWYRIPLSDIEQGLSENFIGDAEEPWTLSVGEPFGVVALFHNNQLIGEMGSRQDPVSIYRWPISFRLTPDQLGPGEFLYVHLQRPNSDGWIFSNYLAPSSELKNYVASQNILRAQLPLWIQLVMCTVGLIMLFLYSFRRDDKQYAWWALMLFTWSLREAVGFFPDPWLSDPESWIALRALSLGAFILCTYQFVKYHIGYERTPFDLGVFCSGALWTLLLLYFVYDDTLTRKLSTIFWTPWTIFVALLCCGMLVWRTMRNPTPETGWLLTVCWFVTGIGLHDYLAPIDPYAVAGNVQYMAYSAGIALTAFTVLLMRRFALALNTAESSNALLEQRVSEQREELERTSALALAAEKKQLVHEERERIMRDVHDGIGGQLVQALSMVSQDSKLSPIEPTLRRALDDLRLIIDSLAVPDGNLPVLLASMRHRLTQPIQRAGLSFDWQMDDLPDSSHLSQSDLLHVLRILQESVTNILKHAEATRLSIIADLDDRNRIRIRVSDDGCGLLAKPDKVGGRGLPGMRKRAAAVGIELTIANNLEGQGTQVQLIMPAANQAAISAGSSSE